MKEIHTVGTVPKSKKNRSKGKIDTPNIRLLSWLCTCTSVKKSGGAKLVLLKNRYDTERRIP
jgi:hypothetical protein